MIRITYRPLEDGYLLEDTAGTLKRIIKDPLILVDMAKAAAKKRNEAGIHVVAGEWVIVFERESFALAETSDDNNESAAQTSDDHLPQVEEKRVEIPAKGIPIEPGKWYEGVTLQAYDDNSMMKPHSFAAGQIAYIKINDWSLTTKAPSWQVMANHWAWHIDQRKAMTLVRATKVATKQAALEKEFARLFSWTVRS
jgi:hypothetical protein